MFRPMKHGCGEGWGRRFAWNDGVRAEGEGPGRHGRHHGRHGGRGRVFEQGQLRLVLLALITQAPRHGYELIKAIEDRLGGGYSPSPGVIYPTLTLISELGYATVSETEGGRKLYTITEEGRAHLAENQAMVDAIFARLDRESASASGSRSPQVLRAVENMKMALRLRLSRGPLTDAEAQAIADALDAATRAIERA